MINASNGKLFFQRENNVLPIIDGEKPQVKQALKKLTTKSTLGKFLKCFIDTVTAPSGSGFGASLSAVEGEVGRSGSWGTAHWEVLPQLGTLK